MTRVLEVLGRAAGGVARHVAHVTGALDGVDGLEIDIAGRADVPVTMPKQVRPLHIPQGWRGHRRAVGALREIERDYDVVHAHGLRAGVDAALAARKGGPPVVVTVHNLVQADIVGAARAVVYRRTEAAVVRLADRVIAPSRQIADHLRTYGKDTRHIEVLHVAAESFARANRSSEEVRAELGLTPQEKLVVTASRLVKQKALHVMIDAIAELDGVVLAIVGRGQLETELRRRAAAKGVERRTHFLGFRDDVADLVAAADVACLSSVWEAVPLAAQEAAFLGTPVVATDVGGTGELIEDGVTGRLVPPNRPSALAGALADVLADPDRAQAYADAARARVAADFSATAMLGRLAEIYRSYAG